MTKIRLANLGFLGVLLVAGGMLPHIVVGQEESPAATRQYAAAAHLQRLKSYDLAAQEWRKFVDEHQGDPRLAQAYYNLGVCEYLNDQPEAAAAAFNKVVRDFPKSENVESAHLYLGASQYALAQGGKSGAAEQAVKTFDALLAKYPQGASVPEALYYRGECLYLGGKKQEAADSYRQVVEKHAQHAFAPDALYALGVCQEELGQHAEAGKSYDAFLKGYPDHGLAAEVTLRRGETLLAAKQYAEALERFEAAASRPGFDLADYATIRQADCQTQLGRHAEAAALYESVPAKFPESQHASRAALAGGKCHYLAGNFAQARNLLADFLQTKGPAAYEAAHWTARTWLEEQQPQKAVEVAEGMIPQARGDKSEWLAPLLMDRADAVYAIAERRKESIGFFEAVAQTAPQDPIGAQALYMAAFASLEVGDNAGALKRAEAFLAAHPKHDLAAEVTQIKAEGHLLLNQWKEADAEYAKLLAQQAEHPDRLLWSVRRALVLQLQGKHDETLKALQPALAAIEAKDPAIADRPDLIAETRHLAGICQLELQQDEAAAASLEAALAAQPKWRHADETLLALARAYARSSRVDKAKATVEKLLADFPQTNLLDKAHYRRGEYAYLSGDYETAAAEYRRVIDGWPESPLVPYALHELGCAQMDRQDNAAAEATLTTLLDAHGKHPVAPTARFSRGMARHRLGKFGPAVEDLQAFLAGRPEPSARCDARYLLGLCQMGLDDYKAAAATLRSLLADEPDYGNGDNVLYQLAWALKLSGDEGEAAKVFQQLATKYPDSPRSGEAYYHIGEFTYARKDYAHAAAAYYKAMQQAGVSELGEKSAHKLGWSYFHQGSFDDALKTFAYQWKTYPQGPLAPDAAFMQAECLFAQKKYSEALEAYDGVENLRSEGFEALRLLHAGQAAGQLKQWKKSLEYLDPCVERFPDSPHAPEAIYERGWAHQNLGSADEAGRLYRQVIEKAGNREVAARAQFMLGELEFARKDYSEAVRSYFKVIYGYSYPTWQAEAYYEAARCFEMLRQTDKAAELYRELAEKFPDSDKTPIAKKRLQDLSG